MDKRKSFHAENSATNLGTINFEQHNANQRVAKANERKEKVFEVLPTPKKGVSGWTTAGYKESLITDCPPGMEAVVQTDYIFITPAGMEFGHVFKTDVNNKYDLKDLNGKRTFFAIETLEAWNEYPSKVREVDLTLLGITGGKICEITGSERGYNVKTENHDLGSFKLHKNEIIVKDGEGMEVFKVVKLIVQDKMEYKVLDYKTNAFVGHIKPTWVTSSDTEEDEGVHVVLPDMFGINYDKQMNPSSKTLLVCLMLLLFYKYNEPVNFGENKKKFMLGVMFNLAVGTIILIMVLVIVVTILLKKPNVGMNSTTSNPTTQSSKPTTKQSSNPTTTQSSKSTTTK